MQRPGSLNAATARRACTHSSTRLKLGALISAARSTIARADAGGALLAHDLGHHREPVAATVTRVCTRETRSDARGGAAAKRQLRAALLPLTSPHS